MAAQFESIFKELGAAAAAGGANPASSVPEVPLDADPTSSASAAPGGADFQETIRRTMERMQASGESATAAATAKGSDDFMAEMLRQMGGDGGLEGSEEDFSKMLLGMMEQLTNKDILYEPMKELNDKFPGWMEKNKDTISQEDRARYELQEGLVKEIVGKFEESGYADSNAADREYIVERMQKVSKYFEGYSPYLRSTDTTSFPRCKLPDHHHQIWWATCPLPKMHWLLLTWILATPSENGTTRAAVLMQIRRYTPSTRKCKADEFYQPLI